MSNNETNNCWEIEELNSTEEVLKKLSRLRLQKNKWVFRGSSREYGRKLIPSIDRIPFDNITDRKSKIKIERESIELFRSTYKLMSSEEEKILLQEEIPTLMMMQHYGAPTRLLDWSLSPYVAAYFAVCDDDGKGGQKGYDGFIWGFDFHRYFCMADQQWKKFPEMTEGGFKDKLTPAFEEDYDKRWSICQFLYQYNFPRILAQDGLFTFTSQFGENHAEIIKELLQGSEYQRIFRIRHEDKQELRQILRDKFNVWHGMIYPDSTGAAESVKEVLRDRVLLMK